MAFDDSRFPQVSLLVNGVMISGVIELEVTSNNHLAANRYRINASLSATGYAIWSEYPLSIEIRLGIDGGWASIITGDVDELDFDIGRGEVNIHGRDLTSRFIESRTQETFQNRTASEIVAVLAARHGLQSDIVNTADIVGRSYQNNYSALTLDQHAGVTTEWDLLIRLAEGEGFDVWVDGQVLNFAPPDQSANSLAITPDDCLSLKLGRRISLAGGLEVTVKSWDCRGQRAVVQKAQSATIGVDSKSYVLLKPNLTDDAARMIAKRVLVQMSQHERSVYIEMPGDLTTRPRDLLVLAETGTDFDGTWTITDVDRRISFGDGFVQTLVARLPAWTAF